MIKLEIHHSITERNRRMGEVKREGGFVVVHGSGQEWKISEVAAKRYHKEKNNNE